MFRTSVGADVEALYPSLEAIQVANIMYQAVMDSQIEFKGVNYQEGARYIALTSTEQECRLGGCYHGDNMFMVPGQVLLELAQLEQK